MKDDKQQGQEPSMKKLRLARETVRLLGSEALAAIVGGGGRFVPMFPSGGCDTRRGC